MNAPMADRNCPKCHGQGYTEYMPDQSRVLAAQHCDCTKAAPMADELRSMARKIVAYAQRDMFPDDVKFWESMLQTFLDRNRVYIPDVCAADPRGDDGYTPDRLRLLADIALLKNKVEDGKQRDELLAEAVAVILDVMNTCEIDEDATERLEELRLRLEGEK